MVEDGSATLPLEMPYPARIRVEAFDVLGRRVATLAEGEAEAGRHQLRLDGGRLASGAYFVRAEVVTAAETRVLTQRVTVVR